MGKIRDRMNERRLKRTLQRIRNETDKIPTDVGDTMKTTMKKPKTIMASKGGRIRKRYGGEDVVTGGEKTKAKPKKKQRGYGQASDGRTRKAHGGSVASRLSKAGPVGKPN